MSHTDRRCVIASAFKQKESLFANPPSSRRERQALRWHESIVARALFGSAQTWTVADPQNVLNMKYAARGDV